MEISNIMLLMKDNALAKTMNMRRAIKNRIVLGVIVGDCFYSLSLAFVVEVLVVTGININFVTAIKTDEMCRD